MSQEDIVVRCNQCGTKNRIPKNRIKDNPVCGKCRARLDMGGYSTKPLDITDKTFQKEVLSFSGTVLMDCWAPWCGPCRMVAPVLDQLASEYAGRLKIAKLNVDDNPVTASQFGIQSIPTMLFFKNGKQVNKLIGAHPKPEIEKQIRAIL
ncbi:MAG: thioredoxin TrxC [Deltaproteobacteria bacterium]|nr:thioredoxin TrxC [Deltaproteobacteria bacterium]